MVRCTEIIETYILYNRFEHSAKMEIFDTLNSSAKRQAIGENVFVKPKEASTKARKLF